MEWDLLNSRIAALFLEALLFGILIITYSMGTWSLLRGDSRRAFTRRNFVALGVSSLMCLLAFIVSPICLWIKAQGGDSDVGLQHLCLTVYTTANGFVTNGDSRKTIFTTLYNSNLLRTSADAGRFYLYVTQTLIGNAFIVRRAFPRDLSPYSLIPGTDVPSLHCLGGPMGSNNWAGSVVRH